MVASFRLQRHIARKTAKLQPSLFERAGVSRATAAYPENGSQRLISKRPIADRARSPRNGIAEAQPERGLQSAHRRSGINSALPRPTWRALYFFMRRGMGDSWRALFRFFACIGTMNLIC